MKINLKTICLLLASSLITTLANAQASNSLGFTKPTQTFQTDGGQAVMTSEFSDIQGNPFTTNDWVKGDVKFADGSQAKDIQLKYSDWKDAVYTKADGGQLGG